jgi:hypothetical protein
VFEYWLSSKCTHTENMATRVHKDYAQVQDTHYAHGGITAIATTSSKNRR